MDRRTFLINSAALAAGAAAGELKDIAQTSQAMAPPVATNATPAESAPFLWEAAGLRFAFEFSGNRLRFRSLLPRGVADPKDLPACTDVSGLETSIHCTGEDVPDHHGAKLTAGSPGIRMVFAGRNEQDGSRGKRLVLTHQDAALGLRVESIYETFGDIPVVRRWTKVTNHSANPVGLEYVSSAMLNNFAGPDSFQDDLKLHFAFNSWRSEAQWRTVRFADAGLIQNGSFAVSGILFSTIGSWPCESFLPMAMVENFRNGVIWFWQLEHNGSWHCEIAQTASRALYAYFGGPDALHGQSWKNLAPGETFESIPVAVGCVEGGFEEAVAALTQYRRAIQLHRRSDSARCPVIFNDVVALDGNQTTANEIPLIDAAAAAGCEVYCMDVGWFAKPGQNWWGPVGDWEPDPARFPGGFKKLIDYIRRKGMVPGLWIEPEVAGLGTSLSRRPDSWFFQRHGKRVIDHSRHQLDFRNPEVRDYVDAVFARLLGEYGIEYVKLDYNINAGEGTDWRAESPGQGLLAHNRAFLAWLDALLARYPQLTLETVASGGMRMEYSMLSRAQLQSISDQDDYRRYASIVTGCCAALLPEQMGVWSQPLEHDTPEAVSCSMVNAMLGRIHQSGFLPRLKPASLSQVKQGIAVYKQKIRQYIPQFTPFYPLPMPDLTRPEVPAALGMRAAGKQFLAVWRRGGPEEVYVPCRTSSFSLLYPVDLGIRVFPGANGVVVHLPAPEMGCILST
ncbi:MAG TPA: alpha-galactosidase [Terracidiphilus sp.]|nr:alpha-galactosidase [Terracidiphilus sp.]